MEALEKTIKDLGGYVRWNNDNKTWKVHCAVLPKGSRFCDILPQNEKMSFWLCDFSGVDFSGAHMDGVLFHKSLFNHAEIHKCDLKNVTFDRAVFGGAHVRETKMEDCRFIGCDLQDSEWRHVTVRDGTFDSCSFDHASLTHALVHSCQFQSVHFGNMDQKDVVLEFCELNKCTFSGRHSRFEDCQWKNCIFRQCSNDRFCSYLAVKDSFLLDCDFARATFCYAEFANCAIEGGNFAEVVMHRCKLYDSRLVDVFLADSRWNDTLIVECCWRDIALMDGASLEGNVMSSTFENVDFSRARFAASMYNCRFPQCTMPAGVNPEMTGCR